MRLVARKEDNSAGNNLLRTSWYVLRASLAEDFVGSACLAGTELMAAFKSFEEIEAWLQARTLTRMVYDSSGKGAFGRDFSLRDQIRRAAVSVMSNIAEGFGRGGAREFIQFLSMARGSASEVSAQLYVAFDQGYLTEGAFRELREQANRTGSVISGLMRYLQTAKFKGSKFAPQSTM